MGWESYEAFYRSELQGAWALVGVPALLLLWLAGPGRRLLAQAGPRGPFVWRYALVFGVLTIVDPLAGGPFGRWVGWPAAVGSAVMFLFVWIGDFRVLALAFGLSGDDDAWPRRAALWTFLVPLLDLVLFFGLLRTLWPDVPDQMLWLIHELAFLGLALWLRRGRGPVESRGLAYVAVYYALWASADVLILAEVDAGWLLRIVPNQLYYAFWLPFVVATYLRCFRSDMARR